MISVAPPPQPEPEVPVSGDDTPVTWLASEPANMAVIVPKSTAKAPAGFGVPGGWSLCAGGRLWPAAAAEDDEAVDSFVVGFALAASDAFQSSWISCLVFLLSLDRSDAGKYGGRSEPCSGFVNTRL